MEPSEHTLRLVADLLSHLAREFRELDFAPIGERPRLVLLWHCAVVGHAELKIRALALCPFLMLVSPRTWQLLLLNLEMERTVLGGQHVA